VTPTWARNFFFLDELKHHAEVYDIDPVLIAAIVYTESRGNTWAMRYEDHFRYIVRPEQWAQRVGVSIDTEVIAQKCSWGLMQLMGGTAREVGFEEALPRLLLPENGIKYGCAYLKRQLVKYGKTEPAVSAYNQGSARIRADGTFQNSAYVNSVMTRFLEK